MKLLPSEPITFVGFDWIKQAHCTIWDRPHNIGTLCFNVESSSHTLNLADEGTEWIRGHHEESSTEAKALLAAHALGRSHVA